MSASPWTLDTLRAVLHHGVLRAQIDLRDPAAGLHDVELSQATVPGRWFGLLAPGIDATPIDAYVRGEDLVATYPQTSDCAMRVQAYWRCGAEPSKLMIELQVSVQTDALGVATPLVVYSQLEGSSAARLVDCDRSHFDPLVAPAGTEQWLTPREGAGCYLFGLPSSEWCYAQMIHSADFQHDRICLDATPRGLSRLTLEHCLFPGELEKGVILRARIRGMFLPRAAAAEAAAECYRQFLCDPLPLTT